MDKEELLKDWLEGKIDPAEMEKLKSDPDTRAYLLELEDIITQTAKIKVPAKTTTEDAWALFEDKIEEKSKAPKTFQIGKYLPFAIAAVVTLLISFYFLLPGTTLVQTSYQQQLTYSLPDGSIVILNADSKLTYKNDGWSDDRHVELQGEAYFDVQHGTGFRVETSEGFVEVLGTTFNVFSRENGLKVACYSGKVSVSKKDNRRQKTTLAAGKQIQFNSSNQNFMIDLDISKADWRTGDFYYEKVPLTEVIAELKRQYDIDIEYETDTPREYTGYFSNRNLDEALKLVFAPMSLEYTKEGRKVIVR